MQTDDKPRITLAEADVLAAEVLELLRPATERIAVAGSIRRRRPDVGDGNQLFGGDGRVIETPTEEAFFQAIGLKTLEPWQRA